jgi:hypothetical protein
MRIAIDARAAGKKVGIGIYASNLVDGLARLGDGAEYLLYVSSDSSVPANGHLKAKKAWGSLEDHIRGDFWEQVVLPFELKRSSIDVYHGTNGRLPLLKLGTRYVLTIHDLIPALMPYANTRTFRFYMDKATRASARAADIVIVPSSSTKKDVVRLLGISSGRIRIIYEGVSDRFRVLDKSECLDYLRREYGINGEFILFVGRLEPRKNLARLLASLKLLVEREQVRTRLVLVGGKTWIQEEIVSMARENGLSERLLFIHDAKDNDLPILYNGASVFVLPSLYEGFGLPLLEAMACGTPVVASSVSSIPEVAGEAAILVDPLDPESIADGLKVALFDTARRQKLVESGLKRSKEFSWEKAARETFEVYRECAQGKLE